MASARPAVSSAPRVTASTRTAGLERLTDRYGWHVLAAFGIASGILQVVAIVPYLRDVLAGSTRPHRGSWTIWTVLSTVVLASQWADGGTWSLLMVATQAAGCVATLALSLRRGVGGTSRIELGLLAIAAGGVIAWQRTDDPTLATCAVVAADVIGIGLMIPKTYRDPASETVSTFVIGVCASILALGATGLDAPELMIYPLYLAVADSLLATVILLRRRALDPAPGG